MSEFERLQLLMCHAPHVAVEGWVHLGGFVLMTLVGARILWKLGTAVPRAVSTNDR